MMKGATNKWFHYFRDKRGRAKSDSLEGNLGDYDPQSISVCWDKSGSGRLYSRFSSVRSLYDFCKTRKREERCFFEIIEGRRKQKIYFDIDISGDGDLDAIASRVITSLVSSTISCMRDITGDPDISGRDLMLFESNGEGKRSYHLITHRHAVASHRHNNAFFQRVFNRMNEGERKYMDTSMYSSLQQLRMLGSSKAKSSRVKRIDPSFVDDEGNEVAITSPSRIPKALLGAYYLERSLITFADNCSIIPIDLPEDKRIIEDTIDLPESAIEDALGRISPHIYILREVKGTMICVDRRRSGWCNICRRIHDSESAFIIITYPNGEIFLYCRRKIDDPLSIGFLKMQNNPWLR